MNIYKMAVRKEKRALDGRGRMCYNGCGRNKKMKFGQNEKVLKMYDWAAAPSGGEKEDPEKRTLIVTDRRGDRAAGREKAGGARGRDPDGRGVRNLCGLSGGADGAGKGREQGRRSSRAEFLAAAGIGVAFLHTLTGRRISRHRNYRPFGGACLRGGKKRCGR